MVESEPVKLRNGNCYDFSKYSERRNEEKMIKRKKTNKLRSRLVCILVAVLLILSCMPSTLAADTVSCNISVKVTADGIAPADNTFSFGLYDGDTLIDTKSNKGGIVTFDTIPKEKKEATYTYTVKPLEAGDYIANPETMTATVEVKKNGSCLIWYSCDIPFSDGTFYFYSPYVPPEQPEQTFDSSAITPEKSVTATTNPDEYTLNLTMSGSQLTKTVNTDYVLVIDTSGSMDLRFV